MSAVPKDVVRKPEPEDVGTFWQWLAIGVLIGCWLAEAAWCIDP